MAPVFSKKSWQCVWHLIQVWILKLRKFVTESYCEDHDELFMLGSII